MKSLLRAGLVAALLGVGALARTAHSASFPLPTCLQATGTHRCYSPSEIRSFYGVDKLISAGTTGKGRTIAIVVSYGSPTLSQDLHDFDSAFGLPDPKLTVVSPLGQAQPNTPEGKGWLPETSLDVEWAHAIAPEANILVLTSPVNETEGVQGLPQFLKLLRYAQRHGADVISQSWAATEETLMTKKGRAIVAQLHSFYAGATKQGISLVTASGDSGTAGLTDDLKNFYPYRVAQYPASDPYVLTVGGTTLSLGTDGARNEVVWPNGGGGVSKFFPEPAFQKKLRSQIQSVLKGHRGYPDVAYNGSNESPIPVLLNGQWGSVSGTSAGTPQWAGILALADSAAGKRLGDVHAALYAIARSSRYHADFHDITSGSIKDPPGLASQVPFRATAGWDFTSGLGSPNAANLVPDLVKRAG
jgi:subtilase family serine protease